MVCLLVAFLGFSICSIKSGYSEPTPDYKCIALDFLGHVLEIDISEYAVSTFRSSETAIPGSVRRQTNVRVELNNSVSTFVCVMTFIDGRFWFYRADTAFGSISRVEQASDDCLAIVKKTIKQYQEHFNATYCSEFVQMLDSYLQTHGASTENATLENANAVMTIDRRSDESADSVRNRIDWFYKINNEFKIPFRSIQIVTTGAGLITRLTDNIGVYNVVTTNIALSKDEAIEIARPYIESYARQYNQAIREINATLGFVGDVASKRGDKFSVYPQWAVMGTYDKVNGENVVGYAVMLWADNGVVHHHGPQGSLAQNMNSESMKLLLILGIAAVIIAMLSASSVMAQRRRRFRGIRK